MADKHPSREECMALLAQYHTPAHVIKHCVKVTDTALKIGQALNDKGCSLDLGLIQGAGLIHDIARVEEKHWEIGAEIAEEHGYYKEAEIIRIHMFYNCDPDKDWINETDIICLADRMVKEDQYVGLESRMQAVLEKFRGNPEAVARISERIRDNRRMIGRIEKILGVPIGSVV